MKPPWVTHRTPPARHAHSPPLGEGPAGPHQPPQVPHPSAALLWPAAAGPRPRRRLLQMCGGRAVAVAFLPPSPPRRQAPPARRPQGARSSRRRPRSSPPCASGGGAAGGFPPSTCRLHPAAAVVQPFLHPCLGGTSWKLLQLRSRAQPRERQPGRQKAPRPGRAAPSPPRGFHPPPPSPGVLLLPPPLTHSLTHWEGGGRCPPEERRRRREGGLLFQAPALPAASPSAGAPPLLPTAAAPHPRPGRAAAGQGLSTRGWDAEREAGRTRETLGHGSSLDDLGAAAPISQGCCACCCQDEREKATGRSVLQGPRFFLGGGGRRARDKRSA